ncbi:4-amino-4-deoxychorismate lyase [Natranaerovirga hydrolytica]|uniref:4-amino-4-deoxychorismate lyase n=1 Tax=Natranaerovirga hydrolytica TaxID=680378 RepID=A0A4R1MMG8_9FIRM|nr:aminotransferase class IV [Natranaerovirga hydrolytica]TCK93300.1 4-amino-4-deoxychorismate lyase [Natranaerovirga hydrolytica]
MYIHINGELIQQEKASIHPAAEGFAYGYGVFETIKYEDHKIYFMDEHLERLFQSCKTIHIPINYTKENIKQYAMVLVSKNQIHNGVLKINLTKNKDRSDLILTTRENTYTKTHYDKGFKLTFSKGKRNPYAITTSIKSNNYLENLLEKQRAGKKGYEEVIFENVHDYLAEGAISNIFFIKEGTLYTPACECGLLPGIIRAKVISLARELKLKTEIGEYTKKDLMEAEEIFITNSLLEIMPVSQVGDKALDVTKNPITKVLIKEFDTLKPQ